MLQHELAVHFEGSKTGGSVRQHFQNNSIQPSVYTRAIASGASSSSVKENEYSKDARLFNQLVRHPKMLDRAGKLSWVPRRKSGHEHDSTLEFQLFPTEIVTDDNKEEIRKRIPESIRNQCTFKDRFWWYHGDPANLSGLTKSVKSESEKSRLSSKAIQPVIQRGSITIAGRPLLIEDCFYRSSNAWTCVPDVNLMQDTPIPQYKDGETVVVPLDSVKEPSNIKWSQKDPLSPRIINPQTYTRQDFYDIAEVVWPHEFCLWLDGTLQVMLSKKDFKKKMMVFPEQIGGLRVEFAHGFASSVQLPQSRSSISSYALNSDASMRSRSSSHKSRFCRRNSSSLNRAVSAKDSEGQHKLSITNGGGVCGSITTKEQNLYDKGAKIGSGQSSIASTSANQLKPSQNGHAIISGLSVGSCRISGSQEDVNPTLAAATISPPAQRAHVPCEVIVGVSIELGVPCFVGVKVRDRAADQRPRITVPTSAALEAACKAHKSTGHMKRILKRICGKDSIEVIGLSVWMKSTHEKIGTITRCYDPLLYTHSKHPDDFQHDICLVEGETENSFDDITSPSPQWWNQANSTEPTQIVQHTRLHIVCPTQNDLSDNALAIDGKELAHFAFNLPDRSPNVVYQGIRGVPHIRAKVKPFSYHRPSFEHVFSKDVLATSTLYRFEGVINSWDRFRGAAVVHVGDEGSWESVFGLHSFEYLAGEGNIATKLGWDMAKKEMKRGTLSVWGCRHLPEELTRMELCT